MKSPNHLAKRAQARRAKLLNVIYRSVEELKLDPANPRVHSKKQIRQIGNSIEAFDFNVPILVDRDGNVIVGHGRLLACRKIGITEVPTICLDHLTPAQARAFMIADNRRPLSGNRRRGRGAPDRDDLGTANLHPPPG